MKRRQAQLKLSPLGIQELRWSLELGLLRRLHTMSENAGSWWLLEQSSRAQAESRTTPASPIGTQRCDVLGHSPWLQIRIQMALEAPWIFSYHVIPLDGIQGRLIVIGCFLFAG